MANFGYPFDSQVTFESDGTPIYDRALLSKDLRDLFHKLLTDGIILNPSTNMQVVAGDGMNVIVHSGFCVIQGAMRKFDTDRTLAVQSSDATFDRIDTVVARLNDDINFRNIDLYIRQGVPSSNPARPVLTRNESVYEIGLADLFIAKNTSAISDQRITDTRLETERCGEVSAIYEFDTTTLYNQIQSDLESFNTQEKAEFTAWFDEIKGQLSADAAGNLQNQIGSLPTLTTTEKTNLVGAINELEARPTSTETVRYNEANDYIQVLYNGQWLDSVFAGVKWDGHLYLSGNTYNEKTGGYEITRNDSNDFKLDVNVNGIMTFKRGGKTENSLTGAFSTINKIDITNFNTLAITLRATKGIYTQAIEAGLSSTNNSILSSQKLHWDGLPSGESVFEKKLLNISDLQGSYYLVFYNSHENSYPTFEISEIQLIR